MIWTKEKPTEPGYYWLRMKKTDGLSENIPPRVINIVWVVNKLWIADLKGYEDGFPVDDMHTDFEYSSTPVELPGEA